MTTASRSTLRHAFFTCLLGTLLVGSTLAGCGVEPDPTEALDQRRSSQLGQPVELLHAYSLPWTYRGAGSQPLRFDILLRTSGQRRRVIVRKSAPDGSWGEELVAQQIETLPNGVELWRAEKSYCTGYSCGPQSSTSSTFHDFDFLVEASVDGQVYVDDNQGKRYRLGRIGSNLAGHLLPSRRVLLARPAVVQVYDYDLPSGPVFKRTLQVDVALANIAPSKKLTIHYSGDGFKTSLSAAGHYEHSYRPHTYASIPNPSGLGTEVWRFGTSGDSGVDITALSKATRIDFYLEYEVAGKTYIDDNFGRNYSVAAPLWESVLLRGTFGDPTWSKHHRMQRKIDDKLQVYYETEVLFDNRGAPDRFKFDRHGDWSEAYGENDGGGKLKSGTAELGGDDIAITEGTGRYRVRFWEVSKRYEVEKVQDSYRRTVVLIYGETRPGQDMFIRGGIDHGYAKSALGRDCDQDRDACAIPIRHRNWRNATTKLWKEGDYLLNWWGKEYSQGYRASSAPEGSPLDWSTDSWPAAWGPTRSYERDGYGELALNRWGAHYWVFDVDMDCSKTANGWFELKSYISNGPGWEKDVSQPGAPYASINHFAQCGKLNVFRRGEYAAVAIKGL